jgi:rubrerythrin
MKNFLLTIGIIAAFILMTSGCVPQKPLKTIENLKAAYNGESTASAKYAEYGKIAKAEGNIQIALLFEAASKAEGIHADNHKTVLEKLGIKLESPQFSQFVVKSTKENLEDAIKGEGYEIDTMYPNFLKDAETEKAKDAITSFTWALDTEKKHKAFYTKALQELTANNVASLPVQYYICPKCGNTFDGATVETKCSFCMTAKEKFLMFELIKIK